MQSGLLEMNLDCLRELTQVGCPSSSSFMIVCLRRMRVSSKARAIKFTARPLCCSC